MSKALSENTESNRQVALATKQSAREAKQRNGHLAELLLESKEQVITTFNENQKAVQNVRTQKVEHQHIKEVENCPS